MIGVLELLESLQCLPDHGCCFFNIGRGVRRRDKAGLELGRSEVDSVVETMMKETGEFFDVACFRTGQIDDRAECEEQTKHGTDSVKRGVGLRFGYCFSG